MEDPTRYRFASHDLEQARDGHDSREEPRSALSLVNDPRGNTPEDGAMPEDRAAMALYAAMLPRAHILAGVKRRYLVMAGGVGLLLAGFMVGRHLPPSNTLAHSAVLVPSAAHKTVVAVVAARPAISGSAGILMAKDNQPATPEIMADGQALALAPPAAAPVPAVAQAAPKLEPARLPSTGTMEDQVAQSCRQAIKRRDSKGITATCEGALATDASLANPLLAFAKVQFEKGRSAQAAVWARKVVQVNGLLADAYLIIGVAEQEARHPAAAKNAYQRYLELAPKGAYAEDVRSSLRAF